MPVAALAVIPLTLAVVLVFSGVGKLRHPDDLEGWRTLGVPAWARRTWLLRLHPWGEIVLALAVAVLGGILGVLAGVVAVVLMAAYTVVIVRAWRAPDDTSCACFGDEAPVTATTVVRNGWLTLLAVGTAIVAGWMPPAGGALRAVVTVPPALLALGLAIVAAVTCGVILRSAATAPATPGMAAPGGEAATDDTGDELDYVRTRTPAVPVTLADGTLATLRELTRTRPVLLLAVSTTCGACMPVHEALPRYRELLPEVDVRLLLSDEPAASAWTETAEPQSLHDPNHYVRGSIADWPTPTAVLLGVDGLLAGGPVSGTTAVTAFVDDVYESLHGVRPGEPLPGRDGLAGEFSSPSPR